MHKITIPFSEMDLQELMDGETKVWTYQTDKGADVEVTLMRDDEEMEEEVI